MGVLELNNIVGFFFVLASAPEKSKKKLVNGAYGYYYYYSVAFSCLVYLDIKGQGPLQLSIFNPERNRRKGPDVYLFLHFGSVFSVFASFCSKFSSETGKDDHGLL